MKNNRIQRLASKWMVLIVLLITPLFGQAQEATPSFFERATEQDYLLLFALGLMVFITLTVLVLAVITLKLLKIIVEKEKEISSVEAAVIEEPTLSLWTRFDRAMTDAVPLEDEKSIVLDHDYDGIKELDNHLPPWWKALFYGSIVWGVIYFFVYHVTESLPLQEEEYQVALNEAKDAAAARMVASTDSFDESSVEFSDKPAVLQNGMTIYNRNCAVCHQKDGGGLVGPNLTDEYWLHGGSIKDIFTIVKYGVAEKGMIAWQSQLSPSDMRDVSSYIFSLSGTIPANPKEPQGKLYKPESQNPAPAVQDTTGVTISANEVAQSN
jgi:cytochrome c oxidase cbb3-type subunit 3